MYMYVYIYIYIYTYIHIYNVMLYGGLHRTGPIPTKI